MGAAYAGDFARRGADRGVSAAACKTGGDGVGWGRALIIPVPGVRCPIYVRQILSF